MKRKIIFELDTTKRELKMEVETEFKDGIEKEEPQIIRSNMTNDWIHYCDRSRWQSKNVE